MANQPPVRPWFRLASLRSAPVPAPAPAPAPEPRPTLGLPSFRTASAPSSPQIQPTQPSEPTPPPPPPAADRASAPSSPTQKVSAPSASLPTSPVLKAAVTTSSSLPSFPSPKAAQPPTTSSPDKTATTGRVASPPKTIKPTVRSPMESPKSKPSAPPPSPLILPPSQVKFNSQAEPRIPAVAEPKIVLVQKTVEKPKQWLNGNGESHRETGETPKHGIAHHGKQAPAKETGTKEKGIHRKLSDSEDSGMRVITIAGENRGAFMELIQSPKKHEFGDKPNYLHKKGNSKIEDDGSESESSSSREGNTNRKDKNHKGRTPSSFPMAAYMNSNVQCVNNSLLYNTTCSHHDPGVRLYLKKKPFGEGFQLKERVDGQKSD